MSMLCVAIAGRPNVGKSTIFNRLTRSRKAIVHPMPGVTRDVMSAEVKEGKHRYELLDTGGLIEPDKDGFAPRIWAAAREAMREAHLILFVVDAKQGITPADEILAREIHTLDRDVWVLANKCDSPKDEELANDAYSLGFPIVIPISAEHKLGFGDLTDTMEAYLDAYAQTHPVEEKPVDKNIITVAFTGRPNSGKSSLMNCLLGEERMIVSEIPGTTRDSVDTLCERDGKKYLFIDTAGIRRKAKVKRALEHFSIARARHSLERADVVCLLLDPTRELSQQDMAIARMAVEAGTGLIFVASKWDLVKLNRDEKKEMIDYLRERFFALDYVPVVQTSALKKTGLKSMFKTIDRVFVARKQRISTGVLNRDIQALVDKNPPPSRGRSAFKIRYVSQVADTPPAILIFTNHPKALSPTYCRYLEKGLRQQYGFEGTPLRLFVRGRKARKNGV